MKKEKVNIDFVALMKKMIDDKKKMKAYIKTHGSLKGFKDDIVKFTHPV